VSVRAHNTRNARNTHTQHTQHTTTHNARNKTPPRSYESKYVSVRVDNDHVKLRSWGHAVETLRAARRSGSPYWCSLLEGVRHPAWWPADAARHVPNYDQVGRGRVVFLVVLLCVQVCVRVYLCVYRPGLR
jgi:hypothetical protein